MSLHNEATVKAKLMQWLIRKNPAVNPEALRADTPILESRILSSVQLMDLIYYLEHLSGRRVRIDDIQPGAFTSVNHIYNAFFCKDHG